MGPTACGLVAGLIDWNEGPCSDHGRPRCPTPAVVETLRLFLREGMQWRELGATGDRVGGATLRRRLGDWSAEAPLNRGHAMRVRIVRSGPEAAAVAWDVVIGSCSVRAKRGGELTGPNPTDRAKRGTQYHVIVDHVIVDHVIVASEGIPLAALPCAANGNDTRLVPALLRRALVVCAAITRLDADAAYHSAENHWRCAAEGILPLIRKRGEPHGSGLGTVRCVVEHANA